VDYPTLEVPESHISDFVKNDPLHTPMDLPQPTDPEARISNDAGPVFQYNPDVLQYFSAPMQAGEGTFPDRYTPDYA
jgi:hypothetical protein